MATVIDVYVYNLTGPDPTRTGFPYTVESVTRRGLPTVGAVADAVNVQFSQDDAPGTPVYSRLTWSEGTASGANLQVAYMIDSLADLIRKINA